MLNLETTVYSDYFLNPVDLVLVQSKATIKEEAARWLGIGKRKGIAGVSSTLSRTFRGFDPKDSSTLSVDVDGDAAMDLAIHVPGITGFSATNLIL